MKTTIDLPDGLFYRAKVTAARRRTTLKHLVMEGLEHVMNSPVDAGSKDGSAASDEDLFEIDVYGVPVLKRRGVTVTDAMIDQIRDEEGV